MKYFYLIIVTKKQIKINQNLDVFYINDDCTLIDDRHIKYQNEIYEFEYLIYSSEIHMKYEIPSLIMLENNIPITNFYFQTSLENIYYINENSLEQKINNIINNE